MQCTRASAQQYPGVGASLRCLRTYTATLHRSPDTTQTLIEWVGTLVAANHVRARGVTTWTTHTLSHGASCLPEPLQATQQLGLWSARRCTQHHHHTRRRHPIDPTCTVTHRRTCCSPLRGVLGGVRGGVLPAFLPIVCHRHSERSTTRTPPTRAAARALCCGGTAGEAKPKCRLRCAPEGPPFPCVLLRHPQHLPTHRIVHLSRTLSASTDWMLSSLGHCRRAWRNVQTRVGAEAKGGHGDRTKGSS